MVQMVSIQKRSKKQQRAFYGAKRGSWNGVNPVSRCVPSGKAYNRAKKKRHTEREANARMALF